jgi:hypothetical protein
VGVRRPRQRSERLLALPAVLHGLIGLVVTLDVLLIAVPGTVT